MPPQINILIGIQARSTSTRLPNKVSEVLDGRTILEHCVDSCKRSADYLNRYTFRTGIAVQLALLVPKGDPLVQSWSRRIQVIEGSESDVLSRYVEATKRFGSDYIVRITSDCPLIPPFVISKHIKLAVMNRFDYVSNVDPRFRTSIDGIDCEVFSQKMIEWANANSETKEEREHVTPACRLRPPPWAKIGAVIGFFDESHVKLSVDTREDLDLIRAQFDAVQQKVQAAERLYGRDCVHRF